MKDVRDYGVVQNIADYQNDQFAAAIDAATAAAGAGHSAALPHQRSS